MAALTAKERRDLYSATMQRLTEVIGASGKADELVKLTTQIVQAAKKLAQDTPDAMKNRSTATLAEFVLAAKKIAQDPRAVDSVSLQKLSSSKKAVEALIKELDAWLTSQSAKDETDISLEDILSQTSGGSRSSLLIPSGVNITPATAGAGSVSLKSSSPTESGPAVSEVERKLLNELKRQQAELTRKAEPQEKPSQHGDPEQTLKVVVMGLSRSTGQLMDLAGQKAPSKESLLEPATTLAKMVSILMDLVDSLFVSKFPMRSQVHTFSCMLVDNVVAYGNQSKTEDTASLRLISTQAPALMSALEVMVEQCYKRAQNVRESQQMSLQRNFDLHDLDVFGPGHSPRNSPATKKRKEPPAPPAKAAPPPQVKDFEICVMICTSVAVDNQTNSLLNKGTEITMKATPATNIKNIRAALAQRTKIAMDSIQIRFRGDDVLTDDTRVTPDNPLPYFMFNLNEPGEEEMSEFRKEQRRKNRIRIDTKDWSRVTSPVAVAIYDYEALAEPGEEDNLEFEEGDLIQIVEKSADGWWTGRIDGSVGVFPASFVEMIHVPTTKEERKKLLKRFQQGTLGAADVPEPEPSKSPELQSVQQTQIVSDSSYKQQKQSGNKMFGKTHHSGSDNSDTGGSPSPTKAASVFSKFGDRRSSDPSVANTKEKEGKKKKSSFFKKKHGYSSSSLAPVTDDFQRSPILPYKNKEFRPGIPELEEEMTRIKPPAPATAKSETASAVPPPFRHLNRPKSSPRLAVKGSMPGAAGSDAKMGAKAPVERRTSAEATSEPAPSNAASVKKRRPPPPPPPYAKTYGAKGLHSLVNRQLSDSTDGGKPSSQTLPPPETHTPSPEDDPPISMKVTPASPVRKKPTRSSEEEVFKPVSSSVSIEALALLEEFDEFSSTQSLTTNGVKTQAKTERDYATIPRSELPELLGDEKEEEEEEEEEEEAKEGSRPASVPITMAKPMELEDRPCLTPSPLLSGSGGGFKDESDTSAPPPIKPPRSRSKRLKMKKQLLEEEGVGKQQPSIEDTPPTPPTSERTRPQTPPKTPPKPAVPQPLSAPQPLIPHSPRLEKMPSSSPKPSRPVFHSPKPPSAPPPTVPPPPEPIENGLKQDLKHPEEAGPASSPTAPPRKKTRSLKRPPKKPKPENIPPAKSEIVPPSKSEIIPPAKPQIPVKPKMPQVARAHLETPQSSSAPVSRTASPDDVGVQGKLRSNNSSTSTSSLCSSVSPSPGGVARPKGKTGRTLSYKTAMKCISYLSSDHLVRSDGLFSSASGNPMLIKRLLDAIDKSEEIDLNSLQEAPSVLGLLLLLFDKQHLGCLISHRLSEEMHVSTQSADPITVLGGKLEELDSDYREMLKKLLHLFKRVLKYSDKNHTVVADIDKVFSPVIFENLTPEQSEPLLAYLISTCDFIIS